jgi:DNA-binding CsgD family transcriptional regulator
VVFNDPVPCAEPALEAVRLAVGMRERADALIGRWQQRGHALAFSAAVTMGYATLGAIDFAGRSDYAAVGPVSEQATWLCRAGGPGEILLTQRVRGALGSDVMLEPLGEMQPPESLRPVDVFRVAGLRSIAGAKPSPLSPREHEVALLVTRGLTNRQIAEQLVVTEATAAKHVENILNKLGFSSRAQIAGWMAAARH